MQLCVKNAEKYIKGAKILSRVSMRLNSGSIIGLMGPNGSGKTMLLRAFCGLIQLDSGYVSIDSRIIGKDISFAPSVGILIENPAFISKYTGFYNLKLLASIKNIIHDEEIGETLASVGLDPNDRRTFRKYSLGMKQRLGIAAALMETPELILLDEPFNALDADGIKLVRRLLLEHKSRGALIVMACHDKNELAALADEVYVFEQGRVVNHYARE